MLHGSDLRAAEHECVVTARLDAEQIDGRHAARTKQRVDGHDRRGADTACAAMRRRRAVHHIERRTEVCGRTSQGDGALV
jgi:hypothetical protein